ncbi:MAG: hypothetical protein Ct9H300mP1_33470 [Planctomycetaceae bacterium]|nr:MAG: hypothetical protein Ct9H300mP1_33470 [Planctomycetaceae bacterium]
MNAGAPAPIADDPVVVGLSLEPKERNYRFDRGPAVGGLLPVTATRPRETSPGPPGRRPQRGKVATVTEDGYVTAFGKKGQAAVMVRYGGQAKVSHVTSPFRDNVDLAGFQPNNFIDEHVMARWKRLGTRPSTLCTDPEFIRRAYLDSIGTLPTTGKVEAFLKSARPDKRDQLVDELLGLTGDPKTRSARRVVECLLGVEVGRPAGNNRKQTGVGGMWSLSNWIKRSLREKCPLTGFFREIITARGSTLKNGPANFFRISRKPTDLAETTAQVFLGVRIQCARCHHHPYEVYSQSDY